MSFFQVGRAPRKSVLFAAFLPFPTPFILLQNQAVLRKGYVSRGRWGRDGEACMLHPFNLLSLSLEGVCKFRKPFSDMSRLGRMTTKRD